MSLPLSCLLGLEMTSGLHLWHWNIIFALNFFVKMTNTTMAYQLLWALKSEVLFAFVIVREIKYMYTKMYSGCISGFWLIVCTYAKKWSNLVFFKSSLLPHNSLWAKEILKVAASRFYIFSLHPGLFQTARFFLLSTIRNTFFFSNLVLHNQKKW